MTALRQRLWQRRWRVAGFLSVVAFAVLAGRFWHPFYGFTRFVQLDEADWRSGIPGIRENPVFVYEGFNGYDGAAYTQIAFHPLLDAPELQQAVGNVPYRARRILGSALAWLVAGGNPARIASAYAGLNIVVWLLFAGLLWRGLRVNDLRSWLAWSGVMFSAGALHSVRLALTDLLAAALIVGAIAPGERGRAAGALGSLAAAGLARETALAGVVGLWRGPWTSARAWLTNIARGVVVMLPLLAWIVYIRWKVGPADQGFGNFSWPATGWLEKWRETFADYVRHPTFRWLITTTLLALIGLTAQAAYLLRRVRLDDPWWRVGMSGVAMMTLLGTAVWEGHPGAATRVLLPMGAAFAVLAVRERAATAWLVAGGMTVFSGVLALWHVPQDGRELDAGRFDGGSYIARIDTGWFGVERDRRSAWAWTEREGKLTIETSPRTAFPVQVRIKLRAITPREVEVRDGETVLWRGVVNTQREWIEFAARPQAPGRLSLELGSGAASVRENEQADARGLGFAVYAVEVALVNAAGD
ncbi:MAG: hypothetical protein ACREH8_21575 [Opitutaceae bacterium]